MTEVTWAGGSRSPAPQGGGPSSTNLADLLERILDKGIVVVGDIRVNLLDIELLTIKLRLLIASVDRAKEMGIDWWEHDPTLSSKQSEVLEENRRLRERIAQLEGADGASSGGGTPAVEPAADEDADGDDHEAEPRRTSGTARKTSGTARKSTGTARKAAGGSRRRRTATGDTEAERG
jgi:Gas vesicle protein